jgi:hypothetical protein
MRKAILLALMACLVIPLGGCGGCGGGLEADLRRAASRKRPSDGSNADGKQKSKAESPNEVATAKSTENIPQAEPESQGAKGGSPKENDKPEVSTETPADTVPAKPREEWTETDRRAKSIENLEKIGKALMAYQKKHGRLPPHEYEIDGTGMLSWRVLILEELGYPELRKRFRYEAWDSKNNLPLLDYIPPEYQSPERADTKTNYLAVRGGGFVGKYGTRPEQMTDGAENTVAIVEVDDKLAVEWTKPSEYFPPIETPSSALFGLRGEGAFGIMADGRLVLLPRDMSASRLAALFTGAGGEPIGPSTDLKVPAAEPPPPMLATVVDDPTVANQGVPLDTGDPTTGELTPTKPEEPEGPRIFPGTVAFAADLGKQEVPDDESLAKAREQLKLLFGERFEKAKTRTDRQAFVKELLTEAVNVEQNASDYHELLRIVRDMAAALGETDTALTACQMLEERFQVDPLQQRLTVLESLVKTTGQSAAGDTAGQEAERLQREAFERDLYDLAMPLAEVASGFARVQGNRNEIARLKTAQDSLKESRSLYVAALKAFEKLAANPADADANEAVGRYLCFVKNRWEAGLPYLNRAHDLQLRGMSAVELSPNRTPHETLALADQYWDLAEKTKPPQRRGLHLRAVYCYASIQPRLATSLDKVKVSRRIDEATALYGPEEIESVVGPLRPALDRVYQSDG